MWQDKNNQLYREFEFSDFKQAFAFMKEVAEVAEARNHHPRWTNEWNRVQVWLYTHSAGGVTDRDISFSKDIDKIFKDINSPEDQGPRHMGVRKVKLFADGGSRGNPGPSAGGFAIMDMKDNILYENGKYLGITTNNQAEYHSLKGGLEAAVKMGIREVDVYMDSMLVVNQMKGVYRVKNRDLLPIHEAIKDIVVKFDKVSFSHIPRELNKVADSMVNRVLDAQK